MLFNWSAFPFVRLLLFFISGIIYQLFIGGDVFSAKLLFSFLLLAYIALYVPWGKQYALKPIFGLIAGTILFLFGLILTHCRTAGNSDAHIISVKQKMLYYRATAISETEEKKNAYKITLQVSDINDGLKWRKAQGNVLLYIKKDSLPNIVYGDLLLIKGSPVFIEPPYNPQEFDYKKYLSNRGIYMQHFIDKHALKLVGKASPNPIIILANTFRHQCDSIIRSNVGSDDAYKIASALILGVRNDLDNKLRDAYSATGTMHILAVSGMHVSLIYFILMIFLGRLENNKYGKMILPVVLIVLLWFYALVTGFSASVLRAVMMFTFIVVAKAVNRNSNIYNTLGLSAFVLLCYDPYLIMDVGFQLSYLAVFGIVYVYPKIYYLWETDHWWLDQLWMIICVSLAAQLATFPLSLFYFHQFPVWFLISNLVVIPISTLVLYLGLLLLAICWIPFISDVTGFLTEKLIWLMNKCIFLMQDFPFSVIDKIDINAFETFLLYLIMASLFLFIEVRKIIWYKLSFILISIFIAIQVTEIFIERKQNIFAVYAVRGHSVISFIKGSEAGLITDSALSENESALKFHVYPHLWKCGVKKYSVKAIENIGFKQLQGGKLFVLNGLSIFWIDKSFHQDEFRSIPQVDYILVSNNAVWKADQLKRKQQVKKNIFDSSNKKYFTNKFPQNSIYHVNEKGAYIQYISKPDYKVINPAY